MRVKELLATTESYVNVYKENEKGRFLWWSNVLPSPMNKIDVEDLVIDKIEMEHMWYVDDEETFLCIIARDETAREELKRKICWDRLSEIATDALHGLIEDDYDSAMEYFRDTIELTDTERAYFGVPTEYDNDSSYMDLSTFIKIGNRKEAYEDFCEFEKGFDEDTRNNLTFEEFCVELDKGYGNSGCVQVARLYEDDNGVIWYDNEYA